MKFKINISKEIKHSGVLSCLDWSKNDEVYTIGYAIDLNILNTKISRSFG